MRNVRFLCISIQVQRLNLINLRVLSPDGRRDAFGRAASERSAARQSERENSCTILDNNLFDLKISRINKCSSPTDAIGDGGLAFF